VNTRKPTTVAKARSEKFGFQAEVVQVLDLLVHSLYTNKETFLRELISNASDAIDRLRFESFSEPGLLEAAGPLQIRVSCDKDARTVTVSDNGIGMDREEVIEHIGTIAKSGTREFLLDLTGDQRKDAALIGQFGVGFYSSFVVAERVTLTTRRAGLAEQDGVRWESDGKGEYTLEAAEVPSPGTTVVLHIREDEEDFLDDSQLMSIIQRYSDHISLPILMPRQVPAEGQDGDTDAGEPAVQEVTVNRASPLWTRPRSEISHEEYCAFYRHIASDYADPLAYVHAKLEAPLEYTLLLFIPSKAPYDPWYPDPERGIRLHVRRVFITNDAEQLIPRHLRFVCGVIDSSDLPLNISREMLQDSPLIDRIRSGAAKKVLNLLQDMAENDPAKYAAFWAEFGPILKEGVADDPASQDDIARLLRFTSTRSGTDVQDISFSDYVARMKEGQQEIYYLCAPAPLAARSSPHLEVFNKKGIEVLLLDQEVDTLVVTSLGAFDGRPLRSVAQGVSDLGTLEDEADKEAAQQASGEFGSLLGRMKAVLGDQVWGVRVTSRLTTSPACIVANEPEDFLDMVNRMRGWSGLPNEPVLEVNPQHPLLRRITREPDDQRFADWVHVLYNQAVLTLGAQIGDAAAFVSRLNRLLVGVPEGTGGGADGTQTGADRLGPQPLRLS
jgi:molecular chaperone HtpG